VGKSEPDDKSSSNPTYNVKYMHVNIVLKEIRRLTATKRNTKKVTRNAKWNVMKRCLEIDVSLFELLCGIQSTCA